MATQHPAALHDLPGFITAPGESDLLLTVTTISLISMILALGIFFLKLHSLPERLGHKKLQFEIVGVLGLLSLFTHIHLFWVAGLILALIELPDFTTPLGRIATSLEKVSGNGTSAAMPDDKHHPVANAVVADTKAIVGKTATAAKAAIAEKDV